MLRILGSARTLCNGLTRRDFLAASGLGLLGSQVAARTKSESRHFGKAKACILLFLYGSPSQLETFDPKPDAAVEVRGDLGFTKSVLPGVPVGELVPRCGQILDRVSVIRSMTHTHPIHGVAYATTGVPTIDVAMELSPRDSRHWPYIGSVIDYLDSKKSKKEREIPNNLALPWPFSSRRVGEVPRAGPYAAFLGSAHNPLWTDFRGTATKKMVKTLSADTVDILEPYMGITPESRFELLNATDLPGEVTLDRLDRRKSLLEQFDAKRSELAFEKERATAMGLIGSSYIRKALDLSRESERVRESYGMTLFGQGCLTARRLVEAGARFVSVFWDEFGLAGSGWDTHWDHYNRMKKELCPGFDAAFSGLIADLDTRGMLDDTLVMCLSEHGRTPQINKAKGGGRDHWARAYSTVLAGAGIARGKIVGKTDKIAGDVTEKPVSPKDVLATAYHLLGYDPETTITDRTGRPMPLVQNARVVEDVLS